MKKSLRVLGIAGLGLSVLMIFQNCGPGLNSKESIEQSIASLSNDPESTGPSNSGGSVVITGGTIAGPGGTMATPGGTSASNAFMIRNEWGAFTQSGTLLSQRWGAASAPAGTNRMFVWGGYDRGALELRNDGAIYNSSTGVWTTIADQAFLGARNGAKAVWTGSRVIVWGGLQNGGATNTGAVYDPATNTWADFPQVNPPQARAFHAMVWTGSKLIIWGGYPAISNGPTEITAGAIYDPATMTWTEFSSNGAPTARQWADAVWTGSRMIVWGGFASASGGYVGNGGIYDPATNTWSGMSTSGAPSARDGHVAVWTGSRMLVWGGGNPVTSGLLSLNTGGIYDPGTDTWTPMTLTGAPQGRTLPAHAWLGDKWVIWGGGHGYKASDNSTGVIFR